MTTNLYDAGLDEWRFWETDTFRALLIDGGGYTFDATHHFVADVSTDECVLAGYARPTITTPTRTVDGGLHRITYDGDDPDFGSIAGGGSLTDMILFRFVTNDADSIVLARYVISPPIATDGSDVTVPIDAAGFNYVDAA